MAVGIGHLSVAEVLPQDGHRLGLGLAALLGHQGDVVPAAYEFVGHDRGVHLRATQEGFDDGVVQVGEDGDLHEARSSTEAPVGSALTT